MYLKAKLILFCLFISSIRAQVCPFQEIKGCVCTLALQQYDVKCTSPMPTEANYFPLRSLDQSALKNINDLIIQGYDFKSIPAQAFQGLTIYLLQLKNNSLETLTNDAFKSIAGLSALVINEPMFKSMENETLKPLKFKLIQLSMSRSNLNYDKLENVRQNFQFVQSLKYLTLSFNQIEKLNVDTFSLLPSLDTLDLGSNLLSGRQNATLLSKNKALSVLNLAGNKFTKLSDVMVPIVYVRSTLTSLDLSSNQIDEVTVFLTLSRLTDLSLQNNQIKWINESSQWSKLTALTRLKLGLNKIELIEANALNTLASLEELDLANNYLDQVPIITYLMNLNSLYLNNQNGRLLNIPNKAFFRDGSIVYNKPLFINLDSNELKFSPNSFCSGLKTDLKTLSISYSSMKTANLCLFKQLDTNSIVFVGDFSGVADVSEVCNCGLKLFGSANKIDFSQGACKGLNALQCDSSSFVDTCASQTQFDCSVSTLAPTTATTSKTSIATTLSPDSTTSKAGTGSTIATTKDNQETVVTSTSQSLTSKVINNSSNLKFNWNFLLYLFIFCRFCF